jgi:outer membrane protein assembly factor BamE (lipoprotein component of BamABCDE complex)
MALCLLLNTGCLYIPLPEHAATGARSTGSSKVTPEIVSSLQPGRSTRTDVLLLLGKPEERHEADRFLIYRWSAVTGMVAVGVPGGGGATDVVTDYAYCLEFSEDGVLKRHERLGGRLKGEMSSQLLHWMHGDGE